MRADVEHRAALEPPTVRERSAEERARDEARPAADRFDARGLGQERRAAPGSNRYVSITSVPTPASPTASTIACAPATSSPSGFSSRSVLPGPARRGSRASGCAAGVTAIATASHVSSSASRSSNAGTPQLRRPSSCAWAAVRDQTPRHAGLRARPRASARSSCAPTGRRRSRPIARGSVTGATLPLRPCPT